MLIEGVVVLRNFVFDIDCSAVTTIAAKVLTPLERANINAVPVGPCVYVVTRSGLVQYIGQTIDFPTRFVAGINNRNLGYKWPNSGGISRVFVFELLSVSESYGEAVEIDLAMLVRAILSHWPVELSLLSPQNALRHSSTFHNSIYTAYKILIVLLNSKHLAFGGSDSMMLECFKAHEISSHESGLDSAPGVTTMAAVLAKIHSQSVRDRLKILINAVLATSSLASYSVALVALSNYMGSCKASGGLAPHTVQYIEDYVMYSWRSWRSLFLPIP